MRPTTAEIKSTISNKTPSHTHAMASRSYAIYSTPVAADSDTPSEHGGRPGAWARAVRMWHISLLQLAKSDPETFVPLILLHLSPVDVGYAKLRPAR